MKLSLPQRLLSGLVGGLALASSASAATIALAPNADAYIRNSTLTTNYGTAVNLIANDNIPRVFFLRFDLSSVVGSISGLKLELVTSAGLAGTSESFNIYGLVAVENWTETGITWSNAPGVINTYTASTGTTAQILDTPDLFGGGTVLSNFSNNSVAGSTDVFFDVTSGPVFDFLQADSDKVVTFMVAETGAVDAAGIGWNSKETTPAPKLTVTTVPEPAMGMLLGSAGSVALLVSRRRQG